MLKDPVYDMDVFADSEYQYIHESTDYRFCSEHCLQKFQASPSDYLHAKADSSHEVSTDTWVGLYTCPMHPEIQQ